MSILKQSTAATIKLGPFVDDGDGKTAETGLTISQADIRLSKNGGDFAQTNNSAGATADEFGYYDVPLDTTDTNTLGRLRVAVLESGALPVWQDFIVVTANVYDSLFSTDKLDCAVVEIATDALTAEAVKADAITKIQNGLALEATLAAIKGAGWTDQTLVALMTAISAITGMDIAEIAVAVWANSTRTLTGQSANVSVISPVVKDGNIRIIAGDDYKEIDGRALVWSSTDWPDLTGSDILFVCKNGVIEMKVLASGVGEQSIQLELSTIDTANLKGTLYFYIRAVLATGNIATLVAGKGSCE